MTTSCISVGIDLGTSNSCAAIYIDGHIETIIDDRDDRITPSSVYYNDDSVVVGKDAYKAAIVKPQNVVFDAKRMIGRQFNDKVIQENRKKWPFTVNENAKKQLIIKIPTNSSMIQVLPEQVLAEILKKLKHNIAAKFGSDKQIAAVITIPSYFTSAQRDATKRAAELTNLKVLKFLHEPTAAALAMAEGLDPVQNNRLLLVYDLGAGTFDVSLTKFTNGNGQVISVDGDSFLGGRDFDNNLFNYVRKQLTTNYKISSENASGISKQKQFRKLHLACENAKCELSLKDTAQIELTFFDVEVQVSITRKEFEDLNQTLFHRTLEIVESALAKANVDKHQVDDILLIGGSTRIVKIQEMITKMFGKAPSKRINPDEAVARGAALQAYSLSGGTLPVSLPEVVDATAHSLGIEVDDGTIDTIIARNSNIPIKVSKTYTTSVDNQQVFIIRVYEGDDQIAKNNRLLGNFLMENIEVKEKGECDISLTFCLDRNNSLKVTAKVLSQNISQELAFNVPTSYNYL